MMPQGLAHTLEEELHSGVFFGGTFQGKQAAMSPHGLGALPELGDIQRYWAILTIQLNTPLAHAVLGAAAKHVIDLVVRWASERKTVKEKKLKVRLYRPDGKLLTDRDL